MFHKYIKYKKKYLQLKQLNQYGSSQKITVSEDSAFNFNKMFDCLNWFDENKESLEINTIQELKEKYEEEKQKIMRLPQVAEDDSYKMILKKAIYYKKHGIETLYKIIRLNQCGQEFLEIIAVFSLVQDFMLKIYKNLTFVMIVGGMIRDIISNNKIPNDLDLIIVGDYDNFFNILYTIMNLLDFDVEKPKPLTDRQGRMPTTIWTMQFKNFLYEFAPLRKSELYRNNSLIGTELYDSIGLDKDDIIQLTNYLVNDSKRRDFTVNALGIFKDLTNNWVLYSPILNEDDALTDLMNLILQRVAINTFTNDSTRIFRLIKFLLRGYKINQTFKIRDDEKQCLRTLASQRANDIFISLLSSCRETIKTFKWMIDPKIDILESFCLFGKQIVTCKSEQLSSHSGNSEICDYEPLHDKVISPEVAQQLITLVNDKHTIPYVVKPEDDQKIKNTYQGKFNKNLSLKFSKFLKTNKMDNIDLKKIDTLLEQPLAPEIKDRLQEFKSEYERINTIEIDAIRASPEYQEIINSFSKTIQINDEPNKQLHLFLLLLEYTLIDSAKLNIDPIIAGLTWHIPKIKGIFGSPGHIYFREQLKQLKQ